jgi:hypothetical protein
MVLVRRIFWLVVACLAASLAYTVLQRRRDEQPPEVPPVWPPFDGGDGHVTALAAPAVPEEPPAGVGPSAKASWVPPALGACPDGYPVKAKQSSRIYHVPGGRFYDRTVPDRCYADPAAAEADGYRASKS